MTQEQIDELISKKVKIRTEQFMALANIAKTSKEDICETSYRLGLIAGMEIQEIISMHKKNK